MFYRDAESGHARGGHQWARGRFLMLWTPAEQVSFSKESEVRAAGRFVRLSQCGHFMMGSARVGAHHVSLSGSYGADGLTLEAPADLWPLLLPLPEIERLAFWSGGGHNAAGSEAAILRRWAQANDALLRRAGTRRLFRGSRSIMAGP